MKSLFLTCSLTFFFVFHLFSQVHTSEKPHWVKQQSYETDPDIDLEEVSEGYAILMFNQQTHITEQKNYYRRVYKIFENAGVQSASDITANYDPTYQTLEFHEISVIRKGKVINKLNPDHFQVIRRETNAENYLYDGTLSATINLSDIRVGDIIDYSFTITGFNPIHKGIFSGTYPLNNAEPIGKIAIDIFSNRDLVYKTTNTDVKPKITKEGHFSRYSWNMLNTDKIEFEDNTPFWKFTFQNLFISEYRNWQDVVDWGEEVFRVKEPVSTEMLARIKAIETGYSTQGEKIAAVLNFVQEEVRYLGFESGLGSYKPFAPNQVFEQRYGDCKDKSLLMVTMLRKMGIEAYPVLVNTALKHNINAVLPTPTTFDHCVVKVIDGAGNDLWYDPTMTYQGGTFDRIYFPDYEYGLVLKKGNKTLDSIHSFSSNLIKVRDEYELEEIGKGATLRVTTVYHEGEADNMRSLFKTNGISSIKKQFSNYYKNYFDHVTALDNPTFVDDSIKNRFTVHESYKLDSIWSPMEGNENMLSTRFLPLSLLDILTLPGESQRKNEYALYYPATRIHDIRIKLPNKWGISDMEKNISCDAFYYNANINYLPSDDLLKIHHYFKSQKKYVTSDEFPEYVKNLKELDNNMAYLLYIPKNYSVSETSSLSGLPAVLLFSLFVIVSLAVLGGLGVVIYFAIRSLNRSKT